jgi:glycine/D-amino acid oxidase-like deaminating enzyme
MTAKNIIVVGAGIIGASIAWHLTRAGAPVTIVEAGEAGGVATPASFAWINASWGNPEPYFRLRTLSMAEWSRLAGEVPGIALGWGGGLCWDLPADKLRAYAAEHGAWDYGIRLVEQAEATRIEPKLAEPPELAVHVAAEGAVEPAPAARALVADAVKSGAELLERASPPSDRGRRCRPWRRDREGRTARRRSRAGGGRSSAGARCHGRRSRPARGLARPRHPLAAGGQAAQWAGHRGRARHTAGRRRSHHRLGELCRRRSRSRPGRDGAGAVRAGAQRAGRRRSFGVRPPHHRLSADARGFPIIGCAPGVEGLYLAVTHSGITLAPAIGLFAATELLRGREEALLSPYRPARFG